LTVPGVVTDLRSVPRSAAPGKETGYERLPEARLSAGDGKAQVVWVPRRHRTSDESRWSCSRSNSRPLGGLMNRPL
jgi:hypothetical protein